MDAQEKKLLMIVNPRAGKNKSRGPLYDAAAIFSGNGYLVRIHNTVAPGDARDCARREGGHYDAVVAVGGDGTLNEVVTGLMKLDAPPPLGYLPQGSTNDFAASLKLSQDPAEAAMTVAQSAGRRLDIGQWNRRYFVYVASFGAFTRSSYSAPQNVKNALGHFAYLLEGVKDLDSLRPYPIRLTADGENLDGEYLFGAICNTLSIGGIVKLTPEQVALDDGVNIPPRGVDSCGNVGRSAVVAGWRVRPRRPVRGYLQQASGAVHAVVSHASCLSTGTGRFLGCDKAFYVSLNIFRIFTNPRDDLSMSGRAVIFCQIAYDCPSDGLSQVHFRRAVRQGFPAPENTLS